MKHLSFMTGAMGVALLLSGSFVTTAAAQGIPDGAQAGPATVTAKNKCSTARKAFKTNDLSFDSTTSAAFVAVPGTDIAFTTLKTGCVIVTFSGMTFAANAPVANQLMMVQAYLDGAPLAPGEVQFSGDDDEDGDGRWARTQSYTWVHPSVAPGGHTVIMGYRSFFGGSVFMHARTTVVQYK